MSTVICNNINCGLRGSKFCGRDFVSLNQFGQCKVWFYDNGQPRQMPFYPIYDEEKAKPEEEANLQIPHDENNEETPSADNEEVGANKKEGQEEKMREKE